MAMGSFLFDLYHVCTCSNLDMHIECTPQIQICALLRRSELDASRCVNN
jgi:hypothetical protein